MSDWSKNVDSLQRGVDADIRGTADAVKSSARAAAQSVKESASGAVASTGDLVRDNARRAAELGEAAADTVLPQIRNQPFITAAVCLGLGVLAGILIARRG